MSDNPLVSLERVTVDMVMTEGGGSIGLRGVVHDPVRRLRAAELVLDQRGVRLDASAVILETHLLEPQQSGLIEPTYASGLDGGFFLSATFPASNRLEDGLACIDARLTWSDARCSDIRLGFVRIQHVRPLALSVPGPDDPVGIAMATYRPNPARFADQVQSLRRQTVENWVCVISDDASDPGSLAMMKAVIGDDRRFHLLLNRRSLGFYRNFERALAAVPDRCRYIALSDQDDVWRCDRLEKGLAALRDGGCCVFSDMDVVRAGGKTLSPTFWVHRRKDYGSLSGLLLANVATGMTMLFDRTLAERALPFPAAPNLVYHDHWLALLAEQGRGLRYVVESLVSYIQHTGNHTGALTPPQPARTAVRTGLRRLYHIISIPFRRSSDPARVRNLLADLAYWSCGEAARFRILTSSLAQRTGSGGDAQARHAMSLCRRFGLISALTAGIDWKDRYRRSVMIHLFIAARTKSLVLAYVAWSRRRQRRAATPARSTP